MEFMFLQVLGPEFSKTLGQFEVSFTRRVGGVPFGVFVG